MRTGGPAIEIAHDRDANGVGGPYGEERSFDAVDFDQMGAELVVEPEVTALFEQVDVVVRQ